MNLQRQISYQNQYSNYEEFIQDRENICQRLDEAQNKLDYLNGKKSDLSKQLALLDPENLKEDQQEEYQQLLKKMSAQS